MDAPRSATSVAGRQELAHAASSTVLGMHFHSREVWGIGSGEPRCFPDASVAGCLAGTALDAACGPCLAVQRCNGWVNNVCVQVQLEHTNLLATNPCRDAAMCDECVCCCNTRLGITWAWGIRPWSLQPTATRAVAAMYNTLYMMAIVMFLLSLFLVVHIQQGIDQVNKQRLPTPASSPFQSPSPQEASSPGVESYLALISVWLSVACAVYFSVAAAVHAQWHCIPVKERYYAAAGGIQLTAPAESTRGCFRHINCNRHVSWALPVALLAAGSALLSRQLARDGLQWDIQRAFETPTSLHALLHELVRAGGTDFQRFSIGILLGAVVLALACWAAAAVLLLAVMACCVLLAGRLLCCPSHSANTLMPRRLSPLHPLGARAAVASWTALQLRAGWHTLVSTDESFPSQLSPSSSPASSLTSNTSRVAPLALASGPESSLSMQLFPRRRPLGSPTASSSIVFSTEGESEQTAAGSNAAMSSHISSSIISPHSTSTPHVGAAAPHWAGGTTRRSSGFSAWAGASVPPAFRLMHFDPRWPPPPALQRGLSELQVPTAWLVDIQSMQLQVPDPSETPSSADSKDAHSYFEVPSGRATQSLP